MDKTNHLATKRVFGEVCQELEASVKEDGWFATAEAYYTSEKNFEITHKQWKRYYSSSILYRKTTKPVVIEALQQHRSRKIGFLSRSLGQIYNVTPSKREIFKGKCHHITDEQPDVTITLRLSIAYYECSREKNWKCLYRIEISAIHSWFQPSTCILEGKQLRISKILYYDSLPIWWWSIRSIGCEIVGIPTLNDFLLHHLIATINAKAVSLLSDLDIFDN